MKHFKYIAVFVLFLSCTYAQQNLIYNGDFELYDTCPTSISTPGDYQLEHCLGWYSPTYATSDYYNGCASWPVSVPKNTFGFQVAYSGIGYCGLLNQNCTRNTPCDGWWIEYIQSKLNSPLIAAKDYEFSCKIVMSDLGWDFYFWKFGAYFSQNKISKTTAKPFTTVKPQILNQSNNFLKDTLNWIEIKGSFTASGGEEFITLGFYPDTLNIDTLRNNVPFIDLTNYGNYYFIDDVRLYQKECMDNLPNIFTPNGDGINDEWFIEFEEVADLKIYNRWGNLIKAQSKKKASWDGYTTSGEKCSDGVYFYVIQTEDKNYSGSIQLIR